jgi:biopolymer transport protein ExbB
VPGAIKVMFPDSADIVNGYAYIPGTTIIGFYNATIGGVVLDSVPAGIISSVNYAVKNSSTEYVMRNGITVSSHDTVLVANIAWRYAKQLSLNTTATGADVSGNVYGFPVLVRLNSGNFNFSQAQANGQDIRFAKEDNTSLPYEIERWDSANALAEVWVRVDSVYGHDSMQVIMMYWGNVNAADSSNGSRVFDTANGFQGIWHMAQAGGDTVKDATVNRFNGVPVGMTSGSAVDGMIGKAQGFNGLSQYIAIPGTANSVLDFAKDGIYSISAWAYVDTLDSFFHTVFSKGKYDYTLQIYTSNEWEISEFKDLVGWEARRSSATACVWVYITGIRFGAQAYLYVNGALADSATLYPEVSARNTALDASIGKIPDNSSRYFKGKIDEVRVASVAYGADWIKLCYMNQKSVDALIVDKK